MVIRKQAIISWLLDKKNVIDEYSIGAPMTENKIHFGYLYNGMNHLAKVRQNNPDWGLPELLMPSFEKMMEKSAKSFLNIDHELFQEFYNDNTCGILLSKDCGTIIYGFGENKLYIWVFKEDRGQSKLCIYFYAESTENNSRKIYTYPTLIDDNQLFSGDKEKREQIYGTLINKLMIYLALKKHAKVETIIIPTGTINNINNTINEYKQHKEKVRNESGQKVIVMDSKWFRKIINDNNIFVRAHFKLQPKKNKMGEWYKELIFIESYTRHGYHRNATIECRKETENDINQPEANNSNCQK